MAASTSSLPTLEAELVLDAKTTLGEGAMWHRNRLLWVDIEGRKVFVYNPGDGTNQSFSIGQMVSAVVPRAAGGIAMSLHHGFGLLDTATGEIELLSDPQESSDTRFNHGACDPDGRFWAGTMSLTKPRQANAGLYVLDTDRSTRKMFGGATVSNGFGWNRAVDRFYYIDTSTQQVALFDYDREAVALSNRRVLAQIDPATGHPDGMTVDADDNLWVALWGGHAVICLDGRTGEELARIKVGASHVSSCSFGGPDLKDLYITTARSGWSEEAIKAEPLAGGLFRARPGATGVAVVPYGG